MKILTDTDWMPWGKYHLGGDDPRRMQDVPADYLHYMWSNGGRSGPLCYRPTDPVAIYIRRNLEALKQEHPDVIW